MTYVQTKKTTWSWDEEAGELRVTVRGNPAWRNVAADVRSPNDSKDGKCGGGVTLCYHAVLAGWKLQSLLNGAYEVGRKEALEDVRGLS